MGERKTGRKGGRKGESKNGDNNKQPELTCVWTDGFFFFQALSFPPGNINNL